MSKKEGVTGLEERAERECVPEWSKEKGASLGPTPTPSIKALLNQWFLTKLVPLRSSQASCKFRSQASAHTCRIRSFEALRVWHKLPRRRRV